jgi:hypothetical protein
MQPLNIQNVIEEVTRRVIALRDSHLEEALTVTTKSNDSEITRIDDKVISTHQLRDLPPGIPAIQVTRKSLITPAAADWLREQNIEVLRMDVKAIGANGKVDSRQSTWTRVSIVSSASGGTTDGTETFDCIVKAAGRCAEAIDDGDRVILVTDLPSLALITLNRNQNVRAIGVGQATELQKDADVTFSNLFVVDRQSLQFTRIINQIQLLPLNTGAAPKWL